MEKILMVRSTGSFFSEAVETVRKKYPQVKIDILRTRKSLQDISSIAIKGQGFVLESDVFDWRSMPSERVKELRDQSYDSVIFLVRTDKTDYVNVEKICWKIRPAQVMFLNSNSALNQLSIFGFYWRSSKAKFGEISNYAGDVIVLVVLVGLIIFGYLILVPSRLLRRFCRTE